MPKRKRSNEEIFWPKVKVTGPDDCWLWQAGVRGQYGSGYLDGKRVDAHRVSWILHNGAIPAGLDVLHKCDVPLCVNPAHLFLGTHTMNMRDKTAKGRNVAPLGEACGKSKLTSEQVWEIRELLSAGISIGLIGSRFGVTGSAIYCIKKGLTWGHLLTSAERAAATGDEPGGKG